MKKRMAFVWIIACILCLLASGKAEAASTVKWIDSVQLPGYAKKFYQALEESTDNDGKKDYLIMDRYFKPGNAKSSLPNKPKLYQVTQTQTETSMLVAKCDGDWTKADSGYETEEYLLAGSETKNFKGETFAESHEMKSTQIKQYVSSFAPYAEWSKTAYTE